MVKGESNRCRKENGGLEGDYLLALELASSVFIETGKNKKARAVKPWLLAAGDLRISSNVFRIINIFLRDKEESLILPGKNGHTYRIQNSKDALQRESHILQSCLYYPLVRKTRRV